MYYDFLQRNKQRIIMGALLFVGLLVVWSIVIVTDRAGKIPVTIAVVPSDSSITLNGKDVSTGNQWVVPGKYELSVTKDGFAPQKRTINVSSDKKQNVATVSLTAKSDEAKKWAEDNAEKYQNNEKNGALEARIEGEYFAEKNPITTRLPFVDPYYTLSYTPTKDGLVTITVTTPSPRYRFYAVEKIREFGYDPTDFVIEFKDYKNPLEAKS